MLGREIIARLLPLLWCEPKKLSGFLAWNGVKERHPYIREEDSNYRSGTENAGLHQTLRGTILDKYSCFRIASMLSSTPAISFYWYRLCEKFIGFDSVSANVPSANADPIEKFRHFVFPSTRLILKIFLILFAKVSSLETRKIDRSCESEEFIGSAWH